MNVICKILFSKFECDENISWTWQRNVFESTVINVIAVRYDFYR